MDWKQQISAIIAETERNLGSRAVGARAVGPPLYKVPRVADAVRSAFEEPLPSSQAAAPPAAATGGIPKTQFTSAENVLESLRSAHPVDSKSAHARMLESVKFELDIRGSVAQKQLEAVREEVNFALQETERKALDLVKHIEGMVTSAIEGERQVRSAGEETVRRLESSIKSTRQEMLDLMQEAQGTALDHSEVLRRLEQELLAFKLDAETRLVAESKRVTGLIEQQRRDADQIEVATAEETLHRLKEVEVALLKEREFRKTLEQEVASLRADRDGLQSELEGAVEREVAMSNGGPALAALEEKVKECGRLILRMGGDLIEEAKRRQAIEAEVHELRMRLASSEAVSRGGLAGANPLDFATLAGMQQVVGLDEPSYVPPPIPTLDPFDGSGTFPSGSLGGCAASGYGVAGGVSAASTSAAAGAHCGGSYEGQGACGGTSREGAVDGSIAAALCGGDACASQSCASGAVCDPGLTKTWSSSIERAVDVKLRGMPGFCGSSKPMSQSSSCSGLGTQRELQGSASQSQTALSAASLRMTREQLDARVQQILGKHGQALSSDLGSTSPAAPAAARCS